MKATHNFNENLSKICYHCGLKVINNHPLEITKVMRDMCCLGCKAVATAIVANNLTSYYRNRTDFPTTKDQLVPNILNESYDNDVVQKSFVTTDANHKQTTLIVEGIACAACIWLNEQHVNNLVGVVSFRVNLTTHRAILIWNDEQIHLSAVLAAIAEIGYVAHPYKLGLKQQLRQQQKRQILRKLIVAGLGTMQAMSLSMFIYFGAIDNPQYFKLINYALWLVATPVVWYSATVFLKPAWRNIKTINFGMDVPIALAIVLGYGASVVNLLTQTGVVYFDSITMLIFFLLIGRFFEFNAKQKASLAVETTTKLIPTITTILTKNKPLSIAVSQVKINDMLIIKAGNIIPVDGIIIAGTSSINLAMLTGESLPITKTKNDLVIAGSINIENSLTIKTQKVGNHTIMASIVDLLESVTRPPIVKLTNKIASCFVATILIIAIFTFWFWYSEIGIQALWIVISVLVVTCPCALSLATPVAVSIATAMLGKRGMVLAKSHVLSTLTNISAVVFDKTGTLTAGKLTINKVRSYKPEVDVMAIANAIEAYSEHPIATAFNSSADTNLLVTNVQIKPGLGIIATINNTTYTIGNFNLMMDKLPHVNIVDKSRLSSQCVYLADEQQLLAKFYLQDTLRTGASQLIAQLQAMNLAVYMFSGDRKSTCEQLGKQLNISNIQAELLPQDKLTNLRKLQQNQKVLMVGDGINDAPVLAAADVSIAMQQASNLVKTTADVIMLSHDLTTITKTIAYAKKTQVIIKQNITWAIVYNILALPLAILGLVAPWMAALGMSASSLLVVLNSLRLLNK